MPAFTGAPPEDEQYCREFFAHFQDGIVFADVAENGGFTIVSLNPEAERIFGVAAANLRGKPLQEPFPSGLAARWLAYSHACVASGIAQHYEAALPQPAGTRHFTVTLLPLRDAEGQVGRITAVWHDVSAIHETERRVARFFAHVPGFVYSFRKSPQGRFSFPFASPGIEDIYGLRPNAVQNDMAPLHRLAHPDDVAYIEQTIAESARTLGMLKLEFRIQPPGRPERWIESRSTPEREADGGILWHGVMLDITGRKRMEEELKASEAKYRTVFESANDGVFLHRIVEHEGGTEFILHDLNQKGCELWGHTREDILAGNFDLLAMSEAPYTFEEATRRNRLAASGQPQLFDWNLKRGDGSKIWGEVNLRRTRIGGEDFLLAVIRDVSERKAMENALQTREKEFRTLAENLPDNIARYDHQCRLTYANPQLMATLGLPAAQLLGKTPSETVADGCLDAYEAQIRQVLASGETAESFPILPDIGTGRRYHHIRIAVERDAHGDVIGALAIGRDISERKRMEAALATSERESRTLVENSPDTIARYDRACRRIYVNPAFAALTEGGVLALQGKTPTESPGGPNAAIYETKINDVFLTGEDSEFELTWLGKDGKEMCSHIRLTAERDATGVVATVLGVGRDITDLNAFRQQIQYMAFHDPLTALPNRALFNDRLGQALMEAARHGRQAGVMLLDLDHFKNVNDTLGHAAGDKLLREAAVRLSGSLRNGQDTVARLGGDEFAVLLPSVHSPSDLSRIARKLLKTLNHPPLILENKEIFISASLGIALYPDDSQDAEELMKQADSAMYLSKHAGRNSFHFYSKGLTASAHERLSLESDLHHALERGELVLNFQPKIKLDDGSLVGSEALLRWQHPQRGLLLPKQFLGIAEDSGLIVDIGAWVLRTACQTASAWNGPGKPLHKIAINVSARQFHAGNLVAIVSNALQAACCSPEWIELEITESLLLNEDSGVLATLESFRAQGITIAINDFGTGYSTMSYLTRFPIDTLKIDRSFISHLTEQGQHAELVKAIISIAKCFYQHVVAEGVETAEQAALLQTYGCPLAQGYYFGKPVAQQAFGESEDGGVSGD